jgi:hypothetical protein
MRNQLIAVLLIWAHLAGAGQTFNSDVKVNSSTSSTSRTTGALQVVGGVGVQGNVNVGSGTTSTSSTTGAATVNGGLGVSENLNVGGYSGALQVRDNAGSISSSALFEVNSTAKGAIPAPKMTTTQRDAISSPATGLVVYNTTTAKLNQYNGSAWVEVGSGAGGINHLSPNHDAEGGTTGWSRFDDGASTTPVDCTGGSPNASYTFAQSNSSPLRDSNSYLLTKDAANRQGHGVSASFTVPRADRAKIHKISFEYEAGGSYAADDVHVWIYATDGSTTGLIQPSVYKLGGTTTGPPNKYEATFQTTSDGVTYRLCLFQSTTNAFASTLKLDNFQVGPESKTFAAPISEWVSFTPTGSWVANTTYTGKWRRVGDSMEVQAALSLTGAPTAATLTVNLPSGYTIDTTKLNLTASFAQILGHGVLNDTGTRTYEANVTYSSTTAVQVAELDDTVATNLVNATSPITWGNTDTITIRFVVPISGWGTSMLVGTNDDGRVVSARAYNSTTSHNTATYTTIVYTTKAHDTHGALDLTNGFTVPVAGYYVVRGHAVFNTGGGWNGAEEANLAAYKNGSIVQRIGGVTMQAAHGTYVQVSGASVPILCNAGDILTLRGYQSSGGALALLGGDEYNWVAYERVTGPAGIASGETVAATYTTAAGQSITTATTTIIDFGTKERDTHGFCATGAAFKCTAPIAGHYEVTCRQAYSVSADNPFGYIYKNGVELALGQTVDTTNRTPPTITRLVYLNATDYVDCRTRHTTGSNKTLEPSASYNYFSIHRVGP